MSMRRLVTTVALVAMATASAAAGAAGDGNGGPAPGVALGGDGVVSPDGKLRYVSMAVGDGTLVSAIRTNGGRVVRFGWLAGNWGIPLATYGSAAEGLSRDGRSLLLATTAPITPETRSTAFRLVSTKTFRIQRSIRLAGSYAYDALSPDLRTLYLIRYLSIAPEIHYQVRAYDLNAGRLLPNPIIDKREPDEQMQGQPITRATSANGGWVMTLYASPGEPFVHALNTLGRSAVCVDLPWKNSDEALWKVRLRVSGQNLLLEQPNVGKLAVVDMTTWKVTAFRKPV